MPTKQWNRDALMDILQNYSINKIKAIPMHITDISDRMA